MMGFGLLKMATSGSMVRTITTKSSSSSVTPKTKPKRNTKAKPKPKTTSAPETTTEIESAHTTTTRPPETTPEMSVFELLLAQAKPETTTEIESAHTSTTRPETTPEMSVFELLLAQAKPETKTPPFQCTNKKDYERKVKNVNRIANILIKNAEKENPGMMEQMRAQKPMNMAQQLKYHRSLTRGY